MISTFIQELWTIFKLGGEQIKEPEKKLFACNLHISSIWKRLGTALEQTEKTNQGKESMKKLIQLRKRNCNFHSQYQLKKSYKGVRNHLLRSGLT